MSAVGLEVGMARGRPPGALRRVGAGLIFVSLALIGAAFQAGTTQAQVPPPAFVPLGSLKGVPVPEPPNLADFVQDKTTAIQLGKALFWDMQVGGDGKTACASCHFQAGADVRDKNQLNPGPNHTFDVGDPAGAVTAGDFPISPRTDDIMGSHGVFKRSFDGLGKDAATGAVIAVDDCTSVPDPVFHADGLNLRQVTGRNAPSVVDAVFNFRNFWDGRANNDFNGVNPFGQRDPNARIWKVVNGQVEQAPIVIPIASLASQAVGPPNNAVEMSCDGRAFPELGKKLLSPGIMPLGMQHVDPTDSVLHAPLAKTDGDKKGLTKSYADLIRQSFKPEYWSAGDVRVNVRGKDVAFSQMEANFSLFFGLAVQTYESTLVSDGTPFDKFMDGDSTALSADQRAGLAIFTGQGKCANCHGGPELTNASVANVTNQRLERMHMGDDGIAVYDDGFYNTGIRPTLEDVGVGGTDPFGNPLSETGFCQKFVDHGQPCPIKNVNANGQVQNSSIADPVGPRPDENIVAGSLGPQCPAGSHSSIFDPTTGTFTCDRINVLGAHKTPGLRNVELTGPYFNDGGKATLRQVVDFYDRGGDFAVQNQDNLDPDIVPLGLSELQKDQLVAFMLGLTDERVKVESAPFDHPELFVPNGYVTQNGKIAEDGRGEGWARMCTIKATGAAGHPGDPLQPFLQQQCLNRPPVADAGPDATGNEGAPIALAGSASDPDSDSLKLAWSYTPGADVSAGATCTFSSPSTAHTSITCTDNGTYTATLTVMDGTNPAVTDSAIVTVANVAPTVAITGPAAGSVYAVGTPVTFTGTYADPGTADTHTAQWTFDALTTSGSASGGSVSTSYTFTAAGVYKVKLAVTDDDGGTGVATTVGGQEAYVVVYDPSAGFVTGGGWINSPAGAYTADPSLTGRANFGFVSKYQKGATIPTGQTEFQFKLANLYFQSSSYQWLVVSGARAQYKGTGTVNGQEGYTFLLTATDGQVAGGGGVDKFRIKIWNASGVVYDNLVGAGDELSNGQAIAGGSIVIHSN